MAQDKVTLFNLAISGVGQRGKKLSSPEEDDRRAEECRLWYEPVRDQIMRAAFWSACKGYSRLPLLATRDNSAVWVTTDPEPGWLYAYKLPNDYLYPRYLTGYNQFSIGIQQTTTGPVTALFTSVEAPILVYSARQTTIALWDIELYLAISHGLAAAIALPLTGKLNLVSSIESKANSIILSARASALNESQTQFESLPEWFSVRGYSDAPQTDRFIYPFGQLLGAAAGGGNAG